MTTVVAPFAPDASVPSSRLFWAGTPGAVDRPRGPRADGTPDHLNRDVAARAEAGDDVDGSEKRQDHHSRGPVVGEVGPQTDSDRPDGAGQEPCRLVPWR